MSLQQEYIKALFISMIWMKRAVIGTTELSFDTDGYLALVRGFSKLQEIVLQIQFI